VERFFETQAVVRTVPQVSVSHEESAQDANEHAPLEAAN